VPHNENGGRENIAHPLHKGTDASRLTLTHQLKTFVKTTSWAVPQPARHFRKEGCCPIVLTRKTWSGLTAGKSRNANWCYIPLRSNEEQRIGAGGKSHCGCQSLPKRGPTPRGKRIVAMGKAPTGDHPPPTTLKPNCPKVGRRNNGPTAKKQR